MSSNLSKLKKEYWEFREIVLTSVARNGNTERAAGLWKNFFRWRKSLKPGANSVKDRMPWMVFDAIDLMNRKLDKQSRVFEYGAGGSTLFFLDRAAEVVSVEHDEIWYNELVKIIGTNPGWHGHLVKPEPMTHTGSVLPDDPDGFISSSVQFLNQSFKKYACLINDFPDNYFDMIIVDGRARPSCMKQAIPKVKQGGWLVLDNSERPHYDKAMALMQNGFRQVFNKNGVAAYCTWVSKTGIWEKM